MNGAARLLAGRPRQPSAREAAVGLLHRCRAGLAAAVAAFLAASLAACAIAPPAAENLALTASGRLAVRVDATPERPAQSLSAAFEWRGDGERGELTLLSPLGSRLAQARWTPKGTWLITPEGQAQFDSLEALAERTFGERIPLVAWPDWLAGRPWPGAASVPLPAAPTAGAGAGGAANAGSAGSAGSTPGFEQLGWRVDLARYADGRIEALRSAPPTVAVRIVLDKGDEAPARPAAGAATGAVTGAVTGAGASKP